MEFSYKSNCVHFPPNYPHTRAFNLDVHIYVTDFALKLLKTLLGICQPNVITNFTYKGIVLLILFS